MGDSHRLWVNEERTILVRLWESGKLEVATRREPGDTWGPPVECVEENLVPATRWAT